jgi:hypothetical protein
VLRPDGSQRCTRRRRLGVRHASWSIARPDLSLPATGPNARSPT